jgi:hypothetical protein
MWTGLIGIAIALADVVPDWLGWIGVVIGLGLVVGSTEFLGSDEEHGRKLAGDAVPVMYIGWSLWLVALGIALAV